MRTSLYFPALGGGSTLFHCCCGGNMVVPLLLYIFEAFSASYISVLVYKIQKKT